MTLGKVLKVIVVMRSLFIDRTIVKGYNENVYAEDGKVSARPRPACFPGRGRAEEVPGGVTLSPGLRAETPPGAALSV